METQEKQQVKERLEGFDAFISARMQDWQIPGVAIAIVQDNEVVYAQGFGKRNIADDLDVTPQTLFAIGSCTKAFTTTVMGMLVDEGKLDWNKPVREYLPSFQMHDSFASERMTARDLVVHWSGLPRHDLAWYNSRRSRQELFESLRYLEPNKDFRSTWQYQNIMYMTAGYLCEKISGQTWEELVQQRIFTPLGMQKSNFSISESKQSSDFALPYEISQGEIQLTDFYERFEAVGPAGSINSSIEDMSQWLLFQLNEGRHGETQLISKAQLAQIHMPQVIIPEPAKYTEESHYSYSLGWMVATYRGHTIIQHSGGINGFSALTTLLPHDKIGIVVLTNLDNCPAYNIFTYNACDRLLGLAEVDWNERLKKEYNEAMEATEKSLKESSEGYVAGTQPSHTLADYTGNFENAGYGAIAIKEEDGQLLIEMNGMLHPLQHYHYDVFNLVARRFFRSIKVAFLSNLRGDIDRLEASLEPMSGPITFKRAANKEMQDAHFLEQFVGDYEFSGIDLRIEIKGGKTLYALVPGQPEYELVPFKGTEFQVKGQEGFSIEFLRQESGEVKQFVLTQPSGVIKADRK